MQYEFSKPAPLVPSPVLIGLQFHWRYMTSQRRIDAGAGAIDRDSYGFVSLDWLRDDGAM